MAVARDDSALRYLRPTLGIIVLFFGLSFSLMPATLALTPSLTDSYQLTSFGSGPSVSPDGKELVFVNYSTFGPARYPTEIWTIGLDGSNPQLVKETPADMQASNLQFSPDGSKIAFIGERQNDGSRSIIVMRNDGSDTRALIDYENEGINTFVWTTEDRIIYAQQESKNSVSFRQATTASSDAAGSLLQKIAMSNSTRFVVSGNMALLNNNDLIFSAFGAGQGKSSIFSLDLQTGELRKLEGLDDYFLIGLGRDGHSALVGRLGGEASVTMYLADLTEPSEKIQLAEGNFDYAVHEDGDGLVVAYAFAPGGSAPFDANEWKKFGVYISCSDSCGTKPVVFSDGYTIANGQYVKDKTGDSIFIAIAIAVAGGAGIVAAVYMKKVRKNKQAQ